MARLTNNKTIFQPYFSILFVFIGLTSVELNANDETFDHDHVRWSQILSKIVLAKDHTSVVDYQQIIRNPQPLNDYLFTLSAVSKNQYDQWNSGQKISFLINAYNAFTIKLITDHYPIRSIKRIGGLFSGPWDQEFFSLLGKKVGDIDLEYIEHKILRKDFNEPRIHAAINCSSIGCPALRNEAYQASKLETQLEDQMKRFLTDENRNYFKPKKKELHISPIFRWSRSDFEKKSGSLKAFVVPYMSANPEIRKQMLDEDVDIEWTHYDWDLNDSTSESARMKFEKPKSTKK